MSRTKQGDGEISVTEVEQCEECGFDGSAWSDEQAVAEIGELPLKWRAAVAGLSNLAVLRPIDDMWSIAEYTDHVREVMFGMRFILDIAVQDSGRDLGVAPEPSFEPDPRTIDVPAVLDALTHEADELRARLSSLASEDWERWVLIDDRPHNAHWIARHAVHDATHHLGDVERLRTALFPDDET